MFLRRVVESLDAHRARYALVGGYAVALHGAVRGTVDIDIVIPRQRRQYQRAEQALRHIGLEPRLPVTAGEVFDFREEYIRNRNLIAWSFVNHDDPLEMVDILITEDLSALKTIRKAATGFEVRVVAIDDLIAIKEKSRRKQDREDVRALKRIR